MKIFVDCETTGFDYLRDSLLSLATIITDDRGAEIAVFDQKCRPDFNGRAGYKWNMQAQQVHGMTLDFCKRQLHPIEMGVNWINFLSEHIDEPTELSMWVNNSAFDLRMITHWLLKNLDSHYFEMYKYVLHSSYDNVSKCVPSSFPSKKLELIARQVGFDHKAHDALSDTRAMIAVWKKWGNDEELCA